MSSLNNMISNSNLNKHDKPAKLEVSEILNARFVVCKSIVLEYIDYAQKIEGKSRTIIREEILKIADDLTVKYNLGSAFFDDITVYLNKSFQLPASELYDNVKKRSGLDDEVFEMMMSDIRKLPSVSDFSIGFKSIFN